MIPTFIGITVISFIIMHLAPGNPVDLMEQKGGQVTAKKEQISYESIREFRRKYHLDKPLYYQYWIWVKKAIIFDFGDSLIQRGRTVNELLWEKMGVTVVLSGISILIIYIIAIPIGVISSVSENTLLDKTITILLFMLYSLPSFFVAIWLINLFASKEMLDWFPTQGFSLSYSFGKFFYHLALPIFCMTFAGYAYLSRQMRGSMLEVLRQDYIRTARAKGLSEKAVVIKHAMKNSMIPIITIASTIFPALIGGNVIIEIIFNIPGLGRLSFDAILSRDYNVVMAVFYLSSLLTLVGILISDILYVVVNPKITFD